MDDLIRLPAVNAPALHLLLDHAADMVQGVVAGRSLTDLLAGVPASVRPGTQALAFDALRRLGGARAARAAMASKLPPPAVDALLLTALALLWPGPSASYAEHTLVDQAVQAARRRAPASAGFVNALLRRFLRERDALVVAAERTPEGRPRTIRLRFRLRPAEVLGDEVVTGVHGNRVTRTHTGAAS